MEGDRCEAEQCAVRWYGLLPGFDSWRVGRTAVEACSEVAVGNVVWIGFAEVRTLLCAIGKIKLCLSHHFWCFEALWEE
jgi:hypothetical protein